MPKITPMGVMNITPNSFSDGNLNLNQNNFLQHWNELLIWSDIIDIGAESTAPFNSAITAEEEIDRFEKYFFSFASNLKMPKRLSIDTYKVEVFKYVYNRIHELNIQVDLIFNDISGKLDDKLIELLQSDLEFSYIYCHNLAPARQQSSDHMQFTTTGPIVSSVLNSFQSVMSLQLKRKLYLDPCFGFSKSRDQNIELLEAFHTINSKIKYPLVFGISRKSFLRNPPDMNVKDERSKQYLCAMEALLLNHCFSNKSSKEVIVRTHGPEALNALSYYQRLLC